jgi:HNH endonuclease/NUMOD4 motif-containing protein
VNFATWKPVVGYEGLYVISDRGRLIACRKNAPGRSKYGKVFDRVLRPKPIKTGTDRKGYKYVYLYGRGKPWRAFIHTLVLTAFVGPCPPGMEGCHGDGVPANCDVDNLRWDTKKGNHADKILHGTWLSGAQVPGVKLTESQVLSIRADRRIQREIAADYGVCRQTVQLIKARKNWKHI